MVLQLHLVQIPLNRLYFKFSNSLNLVNLHIAVLSNRETLQ